MLNFDCNVSLDPPPLPVTLPPAGAHTKVITTTQTNPNNNERTQATVQTSSWQSQYNNNVTSPESGHLLTSDNFLENERAHSTIPSG